MKRITIILITIAVIVALAGMPLSATATISDDETQDETADESVQPGEQIAGVIAVQAAEIDGELSDRTYDVKIANAQGDEEKADIAKERLDEIEERNEEHESRLSDLEERKDGEITEGQYRAEVATVAAEKANTERAVEQTQATAGELPEDVLEERGINTGAIQDLQDQASELGGPETAEIAQSIAGPSVGSSIAEDRVGAPSDRGPGGEDSVDGTDDEVDSDDNDQTESSGEGGQAE